MIVVCGALHREEGLVESNTFVTPTLIDSRRSQRLDTITITIASSSSSIKALTPSHLHSAPAMGLLTIIRKSAHRERQLRLLFLGLDNSGKSTILKRLLHSPDWDRLSPTLGFDIVSLSHPPYTLNVWDIGGQRTLRPYWRNYFERTDALVWVVDSGDRARMAECRDELWELMVREERLATCSLLVLANKQDLPGAMSSEEIRAALGLEELLRVRGGGEGRILACSAVKEMGYQEGLQWVVEDCEQRLYWSNAVDRQKSLQDGHGLASAGATKEEHPPAMNADALSTRAVVTS